MKRMICTLGALLMVSAAAPAVAQDLTIDDVVELTKIGLGDQAIIAKIEAEDAHFDLTVDQMIDLKAKGVSSEVIAALIADPEDAKPVLSLDSPDPMVAHPAGVYFFAGSGPTAKMVKMNPTVSNQAKTGGIFGYALTSGIASMSIKAAIPNETAKTITQARPTFYFFFDQATDTAATNAWAAGANVTVTSPAEFTLIELKRKKGRREARVGSANIGGSKVGIMDTDRIPFDYTEVRPGVFKVEADNVGEPGEYGFIFPLVGGGTAGAMSARIFDFSVQ